MLFVYKSIGTRCTFSLFTCNIVGSMISQIPRASNNRPTSRLVINQSINQSTSVVKHHQTNQYRESFNLLMKMAPTSNQPSDQSDHFSGWLPTDRPKQLINQSIYEVNHHNRTINRLTREIVIVENIRRVRLLDLTADFGVKTKAGQVDADFQAACEEQNCYSKLSIHS